MKDPTLLERLVMILRTVASIAAWVIAIVFKIVRGLLPGGSDTLVESPSGLGRNEPPAAN